MRRAGGSFPPCMMARECIFQCCRMLGKEAEPEQPDIKDMGTGLGQGCRQTPGRPRDSLGSLDCLPAPSSPPHLLLPLSCPLSPLVQPLRAEHCLRWEQKPSCPLGAPGTFHTLARSLLFLLRWEHGVAGRGEGAIPGTGKSTQKSGGAV